MAHGSEKLIIALRATAQHIATTDKYMWGHMGSCNCGYLAQELSSYSREDIHNFAMQGRGDWREQLEEYCPTSGLPMDLLVSEMLNYGLSTVDLQHLEWLNDPKVLASIPFEKRMTLKHNVKEDVVFYINQWANMLEKELFDIMELNFDQTLEAV